MRTTCAARIETAALAPCVGSEAAIPEESVMTTRFLNRTMLAATIGAALALGSFAPGEARAAQGYAHHEQDAKQAKQDREERAAQRKQAAAAHQAQVQASVEQRQAAIDARVDRNRANAHFANEQRARERDDARLQAQARAEANAHNARLQAEARAEANAARNAQLQAQARANAERQRELAAARERGDERVSPRPNGRALDRSNVHSTIAAQPDVPYGQLVSAERHRRNAERQAQHHDRDRVTDRQRVAIESERLRNQRYRDYLAQRQRDALRRTYDLQRANRMAQYRYQQQYYDRLRQQQMQLRDARYDWYNDPYFYTSPSYRYQRAGNYYQVNRYAADMLREAVRMGYQEGYRAGRADEMDGWRYDYRDSFAYQDANYGYMGYYVDRSEYNYYFREGFRRGYEDGYRRNSQYGRYSNGSPSILETVLSVILNLRSL
jgi:hypothetical protein